MFKAISTERSSKKCKNKVAKKYSQYGNILNTVKKKLSILRSQADSARENWIWSYSYFN